MANSPRLPVQVQRQLIRTYQRALAELPASSSPWVPLLRVQLLRRIRAVRWQDYPAMARLGIYNPSGLQVGVNASRAVCRALETECGL